MIYPECCIYYSFTLVPVVLLYKKNKHDFLENKTDLWQALGVRARTVCFVVFRNPGL